MTGGQFISWGSKIKTFLTQSYLWPWSGVIGDRSHLKYSLYCQMRSFELVLNHSRLISYQFYPLLRPMGVCLSPEGRKLKQSRPKNEPSHDLGPKIVYPTSSVYNNSYIALKLPLKLDTFRNWATLKSKFGGFYLPGVESWSLGSQKWD